MPMDKPAMIAILGRMKGKGSDDEDQKREAMKGFIACVRGDGKDVSDDDADSAIDWWDRLCDSEEPDGDEPEGDDGEEGDGKKGY